MHVTRTERWVLLVLGVGCGVAFFAGDRSGLLGTLSFLLILAGLLLDVEEEPVRRDRA